MYRIGEKVKQYRKKHHLSQTEFATLTGTNRSTISMLENGKFVNLQISTIQAIRKYVMLSGEDLLHDTKPFF